MDTNQSKFQNVTEAQAFQLKEVKKIKQNGTMTTAKKNVSIETSAKPDDIGI